MNRFFASLEYPEIKVTAPDVAFAKKLLAPYASKTSELTAISQYCYNAVVFAKTDPTLSRVMSEIGRVEMVHLNILARLIFMLGYDPKYRTVDKNAPTFWNGDFVNYKKDALSVLQTAIAEEQTAFRDYLALSRQTKDPLVSRILIRLSADEKLHAEMLMLELKKRKK